MDRARDLRQPGAVFQHPGLLCSEIIGPRRAEFLELGPILRAQQLLGKVCDLLTGCPFFRLPHSPGLAEQGGILGQALTKFQGQRASKRACRHTVVGLTLDGRVFAPVACGDRGLALRGEDVFAGALVLEHRISGTVRATDGPRASLNVCGFGQVARGAAKIIHHHTPTSLRRCAKVVCDRDIAVPLPPRDGRPGAVMAPHVVDLTVKLVAQGQIRCADPLLDTTSQGGLSKFCRKCVQNRFLLSDLCCVYQATENSHSLFVRLGVWYMGLAVPVASGLCGCGPGVVSGHRRTRLPLTKLGFPRQSCRLSIFASIDNELSTALLEPLQWATCFFSEPYSTREGLARVDQVREHAHHLLVQCSRTTLALDNRGLGGGSVTELVRQGT